MRGKVAKRVRKELAPREKLQELRPNGPRVSRGEFFRVSTIYETRKVRKWSLNPARQRVNIFTGEKADHEYIRVLGACPRAAQQIVKRKVQEIRRAQ